MIHSVCRSASFCLAAVVAAAWSPLPPAPQAATAPAQLLEQLRGQWVTRTTYHLDSKSGYAGEAAASQVSGSGFVALSTRHSYKGQLSESLRLIGHEPGSEGLIMYVLGPGQCVPVKLHGEWDPQRSLFAFTGQATVVENKPPTAFRTELVCAPTEIEIRDFSAISAAPSSAGAAPSVSSASTAGSPEPQWLRFVTTTLRKP